MSKSLLITRPDHDTETNFLHSFSLDIVDLAKKKLFSVFDLEGDKATKKNFVSYLRKKEPSLICLNGHGNARVVMGHNDLTIVDSSSDLSDAIVYARSCDAGKLLGKELVAKGAKAFVGYTRKFTFFYNPHNITRPKKDTIASLFLDSSNLVATTLIKGHSVDTADSRSKGAMVKNFRKLLTSNATYEERYIAKYLWSNLKSQVVYGDKNSTVY